MPGLSIFQVTYSGVSADGERDVLGSRWVKAPSELMARTATLDAVVAANPWVDIRTLRVQVDHVRTLEPVRGVA